MYKFCLFTFLLLFSVAAKAAETSADDHRVVLSMPDSFDKIVINGNITAEIVFHKQHKGYVVYNVADTLAPKIHCVVDSNRTLVISGVEKEHSVKSRVVVVGCDSLTSVINNEAGTVLAKELPRVADLCLMSNGSGKIKCGNVSADHVMLTNNSTGEMTVGNLKSKFVDIYCNSTKNLEVKSMRCHGTRILNNAAGTITISDLKTRRGEIINNSTGKIDVSGKARAFAVVNYSDGTINISGFSCKRLSSANYGKGLIK